MRSKKSKRSYKVDHPLELIEPYENIDIPDFLGDLQTWFSGIAKKISNFNKVEVHSRPIQPRNSSKMSPHYKSFDDEFATASRFHKDRYRVKNEPKEF